MIIKRSSIESSDSQPTMFMLLESSSPADYTITKSIKTQNGEIPIIDANLQDLDKLNRNRREYRAKSVIGGLKDPGGRPQELMKRKSWCGEAGHPMNPTMERQVTIDPKLTSHRINKWDLRKGNMISGEVEPLADDIYGKKMASNILQGMELAFSLRAVGAAKITESGQLVDGRLSIICYDWVFFPSHKDAYQTAIKNGTLSESTIDMIKHGGNQFVMNESAIITPYKKNEIMDYVKQESAYVDIVLNTMEIYPENMRLSENGKSVVILHEGDTFIVPLEKALSHEINSYLANMTNF